MNGDRRPQGDRDRRPGANGDRRPMNGDRRPQGDRDRRPGQNGYGNRGGNNGGGRPYGGGRPGANGGQGDRNGGRGGNGYRGGNPSGRLDREIDRMNKETAASTEELRGKESREREKDRNKNDRQRNDYDALGGKKQERFINLEKNGGKKKPQQQPKQQPEEDVIRTFERDNEILYQSAWKSQFLSGMMMPIMQFVGNLGYVAVVIMGGYLAMKQSIEVGDIQSFIQYVRNFTQPIQQVAQVANMLQSTAAASERVFEFLEEEEEDQTVENPVHINGLKGSVEFDHVHFGYNPEHIIINDFSAKIKPGQKIAIVGPTGAGKTTMVKLLMRFYDVNSGSIKIDGHDIREFNRSELREMFGMVLQDTWLFKGSIEDNIRYGKLDATHEEVVAAANAAYVHRFVQTLPGGYNMELNEEASNVSQGQKQLLTIARAILADPPIMILDEATSSVDTRTEVRIQKAMDNLMKGRTSFVIAHRLSTIRDADLILVMKDGDIVEQGNHEELLQKNGFYAELYNSQFERSA